MGRCLGTVPTAISGGEIVFRSRSERPRDRFTLRVGLRKFGKVVVTGAANSSDKLGARTSREVTARRRRPSIGVSQVPPIFHVQTVPKVL